MLKPVVVVAACIAAFMAAVKDGRLLHATGMTGSCNVVMLNSDGSQLAACRAGRLEGAPDLSRRGCTSAGARGTTIFWRCPQAP